MKVINISAREACTLDNLPENTVLISINEEYESYHPLKIVESPYLLRLKFTDCTSVLHHNDKPYHPISKDQSAELVNFIECHKDKNFIVHCHAGISRSGAIALYINTVYGHELKENFWQTSHPNAFVLGSLLTTKKFKDYSASTRVNDKRSIILEP